MVSQFPHLFSIANNPLETENQGEVTLQYKHMHYAVSSELLQWLCYNDSTINIVVVIIIITATYNIHTPFLPE